MMTWIYLVYHEVTGTGIPGVEAFGPHAVRDIAATDILKNTGSIEMAADALHDSTDVVRKHYARYLPVDRMRRVNRWLADNLPAVSWGRPQLMRRAA
jgi:hypothetical protein